MAAYTRKQYSGAARNTTTTTLLTNVGTTVGIAATTGWPSIAGIPFYVVLNPSSIYEEKCLATISGSTLTLVRAQDDTTASEHPIGSVIYPVFTANDADEANELVSKLTTKGDILTTDGNNILRLGVGTNGYFLKASSSASAGIEWASIPTINNLDDVGDVTISNIEGGDFLVYDSSASVWVNETIHFITVSDNPPDDEVAEGDLWYNSIELELYTYYSGAWVQMTNSQDGIQELYELVDVLIEDPVYGETLVYNGTEWENGPAGSALTLENARVISLSGNVSGSVLFDGSASVNISTIIQPNSVALGTDTTGNYVNDVTAGTGVVVTHTPSEGSSPTIAIGQAVGTSSSVQFAHISAPLTGNVTGNITGSSGSTTGNAATATALQNARIISLSGDVSGSVSFNGSADASITATIQPNSVALGTDTTGNYMSDLTQGAGVTITHTPGEGSNATIAIGQAVETSASVTFANVTVTGDLTVSGTTTSINTETLTVDDNIIILNNNATGAPSQNAGIEVERGSSTNVALRWNESSDKWETTNDGSTYSVIATNGNIALGTDTTGNSDNVTEGTTNLYFTDGRARTALLADNAGTASGIRFIAPNTGTVELISHEATRFVRVTSNAAVGGGKTEIQGSAEILASSSISDPGNLTVAGSVTVGGGVIFEGDTANDYETTLVATDPTADRTITLPNATTTLVGTDTTQTLSNKTLTTPTINGPEITATGGTPRIHGIYLPEPHFITFEGSTTNEFETVLTVVDPTADRTVSLPDASGTVALSGSIALGTDTTGNYMSDLTQGTGVTITHTPGEGSNATIAIGQDVTASASVTFANVTATSNVSISGRIDKTTIRESVADASVSASVVTADYATGDIFYLGTAPGSNFTVNLTNAPTDNGKAITVVIFVTQGATGYIPNAVQVAGSAQTIKWANGAAPTPTSSAGKIDIFSFTFVRRSSAWTVFGSSNLGY
jgi:hypothetical protein